jgi:hypothetical protein
VIGEKTTSLLLGQPAKHLVPILVQIAIKHLPTAF